MSSSVVLIICLTLSSFICKKFEFCFVTLIRFFLTAFLLIFELEAQDDMGSLSCQFRLNNNLDGETSVVACGDCDNSIRNHIGLSPILTFCNSYLNSFFKL